VAAFHQLCKGRADYKPAKGFEDRWHVIGEGSNPILILKKGDVPKLFNDLFWYIYHLWVDYHYGKELMDWKSMELNQYVIDCVIAIEQHYDHNFSPMRVLIDVTSRRM